MKLFTLFFIAAIGFVSCKKNPPPQPDPEPSSSINRMLVFPNQGGLVKSASYNEASKASVSAVLANGRLSISIFADPKQVNTNGDGIRLAIDASHVSSQLAKDYDFINPSARILQALYVYSFMDSPGIMWSSLTDSQTGVQYEGILHINKYDKERKLISGSYTILAKNLINDPTIKNIGAPIDPANLCNLELNGDFANVKIQ
jgi:hypothetical protein